MREISSFVVSLLGALSSACASEEFDRIGRAAQRVVTEDTSQQVPASPAGASAIQPFAVVLRDPGAFQFGHGLVGYTLQTPGGSVAAWAHSGNWAAGVPPGCDPQICSPVDVDWSFQGRADLGPAPWPPPQNFYDVYPGSSTFDGYRGMAQVVWSGLDGLAAAVVYARENPYGRTDVVVLGSLDGGQTWTGAPKIVSIPTLAKDGTPVDSGGGVVFGSVHASLMYTPERTTIDVGKEPVPILLLWENNPTFGATEDSAGWWMAKVMLGKDGSFIVLRGPTQVDVIPATPLGGARATILGWRSDEDDEVVELAWSERSAPLPACPSDATLPVTWKTSATLDFGASWTCLESAGCEPATNVVTIDQDDAFRPCAATSFAPAEDPGATPVHAVSDRPEFVMSRGNRVRFVAHARSLEGGGMGVVVWRDDFALVTEWSGAGAAWEKVWASPADDGEAFGPALAVSQGKDTIYLGGGVVEMGVPAIPAVTYRSVTADGRVTMRVAMSLLTGESGSWSDIALAEGDGVPWTVTEPWGAYQGVAALEDCVGCPNLQLTYPHMPFLAAWVDQRSGAGSQIWMRRFPFGN